MLRRLNEKVATGLPPKLETLIACPLADAQAGDENPTTVVHPLLMVVHPPLT